MERSFNTGNLTSMKIKIRNGRTVHATRKAIVKLEFTKQLSESNVI